MPYQRHLVLLKPLSVLFVLFFRKLKCQKIKFIQNSGRKVSFKIKASEKFSSYRKLKIFQENNGIGRRHSRKT